MRTEPLFFLVFAFLLGDVAKLPGQELKDAQAVKEEHETLKKFYRHHAKSIDFKLDERDEEKLKLEDHPVFSYIGRDYDYLGTVGPVSGDVFVWTHKGRAVVAGGVLSFPYPMGHRVYQEFQALIETPPMPIRSPSKIGEMWAPRGNRLRPIPGSTSTADEIPSRTRRLIQMRRLAKEFTAETKSAKDGKINPLKLKPSPVFRLNEDELLKANWPVVDGALFVFTNLVGDISEMCLLIECHRSDDGDGVVWKYSPGSLAFQALWLKYKSKVVWHVGQWPEDPGEGNYVSTESIFSISTDAIREAIAN